MLGMYVHTHWGYNNPYAARSWSLANWENYLSGLASLGYDLVKFWPLLDCMPLEPNASDLAFLNKIAKVIDMAHDKFGMKFAITVCPNTIGNDKAAAYSYETRPYFVCEKKINPADPEEVRLFLEGRRRQLAPLAKADMLVVIDSDPGGYIGSTNAEFVQLMKGQISIFREINPNAELYYWMLFGWENYCKFWEATQNRKEGDPPPPHPSPGSTLGTQVFVDTLNEIKKEIAEPWGVLTFWQEHVDATAAAGVADKRIFYPYTTVEAEPTFPMTNYSPDFIGQKICVEYDHALYPRGVMANAQTHCLQLPNTYLFAHYAKHGASVKPDIESFAEDLLTGMGPLLQKSWEALNLSNSDDSALQRSLASELRAHIGKSHPLGKSSGLLFGNPDRFLEDLAMNLDVRAGMADFVATAETPDAPKALRSLLNVLRPWQERLGFLDAGGGPIDGGFYIPLAKLHDPGIDFVLAQMSDWRDITVRNGIMVRFLDAADAYCKSKGC